MQLLRVFTKKEAEEIGDTLRVNWKEVCFEQFRKGLGVEYNELHTEASASCNKTCVAAKQVLAHLMKYPNYYTCLEAVKMQVERKFATKI